MSISPFSARPVSPEAESRRARLALLAATVGIAATLLAYAVSPGVRHAVGHVEHSVKHAVSRVFDRDSKGKKADSKGKKVSSPAHTHTHARVPPRAGGRAVVLKGGKPVSHEPPALSAGG